MAEIKALVPVMTSNTTPSGEVVYVGTVPTITNIYKAFNENTTDAGAPDGRSPLSGSGTLNEILGYYFNKDVYCTSAHFEWAYNWAGGANAWIKIKLVGSNDGTNWDDLSDFVQVNQEQNDNRKADIISTNPNKAYKYLGILYGEYHLTGNTGMPVANEIQFYGTDDPPRIKSPGSIEAIRDWLNASLYNKEEIDDFFIQNNQQGLIPYDLTILSEIPGQFIKLVGQTSGKIYRVCIDSIITKSPNQFVTDSIYYDETTDNFFSINGRTYRKTVAGPAYGTKIHYTNSTAPLFVAKDPEYVKYTTSYGGLFTQRATCEFGNAIWYISGGSYGYTGNYTGEPYFEPSDPTSSDWSQWGLEFLDKIYKSAEKDGYHGLFWFSQGENVKIFDVDSGDELIEYTLSDRKDEIET